MANVMLNILLDWKAFTVKVSFRKKLYLRVVSPTLDHIWMNDVGLYVFYYVKPTVTGINGDWIISHSPHLPHHMRHILFCSHFCMGSKFSSTAMTFFKCDSVGDLLVIYGHLTPTGP